MRLWHMCRHPYPLYKQPPISYNMTQFDCHLFTQKLRENKEKSKEELRSFKHKIAVLVLLILGEGFFLFVRVDHQ